MGNPIFCSPNYLKSTFFTPIIGGGDWTVADWLDNIQDKYFINKAISTNATLASSKFDFDIAVFRDV